MTSGREGKDPNKNRQTSNHHLAGHKRTMTASSDLYFVPTFYSLVIENRLAQNDDLLCAGHFKVDHLLFLTKWLDKGACYGAILYLFVYKN